MIIRTVKDIGLLIKEARVKAGLSQAALAKKINSTQTWISLIENGKSTAEIGLVLQTLTVLGVTMDFRLPAGQADTATDPAPYRL
ncbi:Helix-turn-helix domain protein [compost metagenome]